MNVLVYSGPGVSQTSLTHTLYSLRKLLRSAYAVETVTAQALASHPWAATCALLVIPGGRDVPYVSSLSAATASIKTYIRQGGAFLGICAGAYYASQRVEWEVGTPLEVVGDRPLGFYPGVSEGCVYGGFDYGSESGARAISAELTEDFGGPSEPRRGLYYNGGGHFVEAGRMESQGITPLIRYVDGDGRGKIAAVQCEVRRGIAVLSHIHLEFPLLFEPATSALLKAYPSLPYPERERLDADRREVLGNILRLLRLRLPDAPTSAPSSPFPLPQLLCFPPGTQHNSRSTFLNVIEKDLSPLVDPNSYRTLQDQNDTFRIYENSPPGRLIADARETSFQTEELPHSFPKSIIVCDQDQLPSPELTPFFNIPLYYRELESSRRSSLKSSSSVVIGDALLYGEVVTSTQTLLDKNHILLRALPTPLLSLASHQLTGRGRGGNVWVAPSGCLTFSLALRPARGTLPATALVFVQYLAGLVVTETCRELMGSEAGSRVRLKWPNDIYAVGPNYGTKSGAKEEMTKVGGILVSTTFSGGEVDIVVGVGLNVLNEQPTMSLAQLSNPASGLPPLTLERTMAALMARFHTMWDEFISERGSFKPFLDLYLERWLHSDQLVTLTTTTPPTPVRLVGLTLDHGLLRTIRADAHLRRWDERNEGYIDLQPDGNSFDMLAGLIRMKR